MKQYVSQTQELADIAEALKKTQPGSATWKKLQAQLDRICGTALEEAPGDLFDHDAQTGHEECDD